MLLFDMKEWIIRIIGVVLLISIFSLLTPSGKLNKLIKGVFSFILSLVITSPILSYFTKSDYDYSCIFEEINYDEIYLSYVVQEKVNQKQQSCAKIAQELGITNAQVIIEYSVGQAFEIKISGVTVNLKNSVINSESEHINIIDKLKTKFSEYLNIDKNLVIVYE